MHLPQLGEVRDKHGTTFDHDEMCRRHAIDANGSANSYRYVNEGWLPRRDIGK